MKKIFMLLTVILGVSLITSACIRADEIEKEINNGLSSYKGEEYNKAIKSLEFAAHKIREKKAGQMKTLFPEPLKGWTAETSETTAIGRVFMGGAISGTRVYRKGNSSVKIEIVADSPLIGFVTGIISNPMLAAASPLFKIEKIKGNDAVVEWNESQSEGNMKIVVDNKVLITVSGMHCKRSDIFEYANTIDYGKIKSMASK